MVDIKSDVRRTIFKHALLNAYKHNGRCQVGAVLGKVISERPDLKDLVKDLHYVVGEVVDEVNRLSQDKQLSMLKSNFPDAIIEVPKVKVEEKKLSPLPKAENYSKIVTRFSPNPDCVLHLGSARAIILSHDYAREYGGEFILRFEDTDPRLKKASLVFYNLIREDLKWLGCEWDEEFIQSDRLHLYYKIAENLIGVNGAYVCTCDSPTSHGYITSGRACPCRDLAIEEQMVRWKKMLDGEYKEGQAIVRVKTDLSHPNPAVRDWPALRIIDTSKHPHPRVGSKYYVWPLYNFSTGIDDHLMGITHIIRGKEHLTNTVRQNYMYEYLDWEYPIAIHYGRLKIEGAVLSKSKIIRGVEDGLYKGFDDPRLATFLALKRRGIQPDAIRKLIYDVGIKPVDVVISWSNLYAHNKQIIDKIASRYFAIFEMIELYIHGVKEDVKTSLLKHPDDKLRGYRELRVSQKKGVAVVYVSKLDVEQLLSRPTVRLMGLMNIGSIKFEDNHLKAEFKGMSVRKAKSNEAPIIHWLPTEGLIKTTLIMPTGEKVEGVAEKNLAEEPVDSLVQLERVGFGRIDTKIDSGIVIYFTSR
ncbi:MAG: glutamate--tRNA ligase [Candidatus Methylarchaceae archaeon HK01B]|nr:glutamate--tRNA ligase [Candidatus Methylarchaceae archaeon HK01B]